MSAFKHLRFGKALEEINSSGEDIRANSRVKSRSPGSRGYVGKVSVLRGDSALVHFDNGQKLSVPINHLDLE